MSQAVADRRELYTTQVTRKEIVSEVKRLWDEGAKPDALAFLAEHPEVAQNRNLVADLAFEEFCYRRDAGEELDPNEFVARFPYKSTLCRMLAWQQQLEENPQLVPTGDPSGWPQVGESFLGYTVVDELGRGAFARVFLARQTELGNRLVAIKVSRSGGGAEANILGQLQHDNIVPVHSVETDPATGWTIVCMPYFGRATLHDVLDGVFTNSQPPTQGTALLNVVAPSAGSEPDIALPPAPTLREGSYVDAVVEIGIQLAEALAFAHARKIYHRDLKPSNVLMGPDGRPRLLDFNLSFDAKSSQQLLGGTLPYMSPEQLRATDADYAGPPELLDARSDLYALGVILFELLSGRHPFGPIPWKLPPYQQRQELLKRQEKGASSLREMNPQVSKPLAAIISRCLAWPQTERFADAGELIEALRSCSAPVVRRVRTLRRWLVAAALLIGTGTSLGAFYVIRQANEPSAYEQAMAAYEKGQYGQAEKLFQDSRLREGNSPQAVFWQGRAAMKMGDWAIAKTLLLAADNRAPDAKTKAYVAYCCMRGNPPEWEVAYTYGKAALEQGFTTAAVYNNTALCLANIKRDLKDALDYLEEAAKLNPKLQVVHHNLAKVDFNMSLPENQAPYRGLEAIDEALRVGPPYARLYQDGARLAGQAARARNTQLPEVWRAKAFEYMRLAVKHGLPITDLTGDRFLVKECGFTPEGITQAMIGVEVGMQLAPPPSFILDPIEDDR